MRLPRCGWCGLAIASELVYHCKDKSCDVPICSPNLRDCGFEHWKYRHSARPIVDVKGP